MSVPFATAFLAADPGKTEYAPDGSVVPGTIIVRTGYGSVQPVTGKDLLAFETGDRDTGRIKLYTDARLSARERGQSSGTFVAYGYRVYEIVAEIPYLCGGLPHFKYIAELCPAGRTPDGIAEALGAST